MAKQNKKSKKYKVSIYAVAALIISTATLITYIYSSIYSSCLDLYTDDCRNLNLERTSLENLVANGYLEAALRRYREVSLMPLRKKPHILFPCTWFDFRRDRPNREPLWVLMKTALGQHARDYIVKGTPDKYIGINLANADLSSTKLPDCDFTLVDLYQANLRAADLRGSDFSKAFLLETDLRDCDLGTSSKKKHELTRLYISDSNLILFRLVKSQLVERSAQDVENGQRFYVDDQQAKEWILQLDNNDWSLQYIALSCLRELPNYHENDAVTLAINDLFEQEVIDTMNGKEYVETSIDRLRITADMNLLSELPYDDYFKLLLSTVAEIGDKRVLPILVKFNTEDYEFLTNAFVHSGEPIIDPLTNILNTGSLSLRISAAWVFGNMLWIDQLGHIKDKNLRLKIMQALVDALPYCVCPSDTVEEWQEICYEYSNYLPNDIPQRTDNWFEERMREKYRLRRTIIRAFHMSGDKSIIRILEEISNTDLYLGKNVVGSIREQVEWVINQLNKE